MTKAQEKKAAMYQRIAKHGEDLKTIFCLPPETDPVKLCKKLLRLENKAHRLATAYCNGYFWKSEDGKQYQRCTDEDVDTLGSAILNSVRKALSIKGKPNRIRITFNLDARGYALKLDSKLVRENDWKIHQDLGGYGILAPDLTEGW